MKWILRRIKILTCVGDSESEHFSSVFELLAELPEDVAFPLDGESVLSLGGVHDVHIAKGVSNVYVSVDGESHQGPSWLVEC